MSDESSFGDWEPADSVAMHAEPDPLQVARRIHEDLVAIDAIAGREWHRWPEMSDAEHEVALHLAHEVIDALRERTDLDPEHIARSLHDRRRDLGEVPPWDELSPDEKALAVKLMALVIRWLRMEHDLPERT